MSARDKLNEASFFLEKLSKTKSDDEFRYFFSAFVSAWRSVTFVLQKDYRSKYGDCFDEWYEVEQSRLRGVEGAKDFLKIRTISQKEGNKFPLSVWSCETIAGDKLTWTWDRSRGEKGLLNLQINFANGPVFPVQGNPGSRLFIYREIRGHVYLFSICLITR